MMLIESLIYLHLDYCSVVYFSFLTKELRNKIQLAQNSCLRFVSCTGIKTTIIHPATEKHITKYSSHNCYIVDETPEIYNKIVLPQIIQDKFDLQWVYNILEHKSESDRILIEDTDPVDGFVVVPDLKWNGEIDTLYFLAICNRRDLKSLRDLTGDHLVLLNNIKTKTLQAIEAKYKLDSSQLRIYLHYQPSFYHLHIHFTYIKHEAPGILAERAHLLTIVIGNLQLASDYYKKITIPFVVRENDKLFARLEKEGILKCTKHVFFTSTDDSFGSFKTELLKSHLPNNPLARPCEIAKDLAYMIQCKNCSRNLVDTKIKFQKILPLPDNPDSSDWFCHGHNSNDFCLEPQKNDLFYGNCFVHLYKNCLSNFLTKNDVLVCKFCFNWLGVVEQSATKLWFNTVKFVDDELGVVESTGLSDVCVLIKNLFRNQLFNSLKTILRFKLDDGNVNYLFLWVLEKQLKVVFNDEEKNVAKILFKFFEDDSDEIFVQWHNDYRVEVTDISKVMMVEILKHLHENNGVFPKEFSISNDFLVSYLFMYD
ncbi:unnamed protein product [Ceutorhynchus assimilis]|uniref:m7GpppX diphosphatase n=1 Tax=Ceutorhynchus assimilis TaxID=467358 RepID=A0A9N9MDT0_9CUCU|nr:unnamed protein product [Ceutorhynchus assimilis]